MTRFAGGRAGPTRVVVRPSGRAGRTRPRAVAEASWRRVLGLGVLVPLLGCGAAAGVEGSIAAVLERDRSSGRVLVREVPDGRASSVAGLERGDRLKMIDGTHVDDLDAAALVRALRGPVGRVVRLTVVRGEEVLELEVRREPLGRTVEPVPARPRTE